MAVKGKTNNPGGRPKGKPNKATTEFKKKLNALLEESAPKMAAWLEQIAQEDPAKAFEILSKFVEYIHPKLARTETKLEGEVGIKGITVEHVKPQNTNS